MSSGNTPPAENGRDEARQGMPPPAPMPGATSDDRSGAAMRPSAAVASHSEQPSLPPSGSDPPDTATTNLRVVAGLPPQSQPQPSAKNSLRAILPPATGFASFIGGGGSASALRGAASASSSGAGTGRDNLGSTASPASAAAKSGFSRTEAPRMELPRADRANIRSRQAECGDVGAGIARSTAFVAATPGTTPGLTGTGSGRWRRFGAQTHHAAQSARSSGA